MAERWLVGDTTGDELWRINPDDPGDTSGDFGLVGDFPSGLTSPQGVAYGDGRWLVADAGGDELWRINPDDPGDTSGDFGLVGDFPSGLGSPRGFAYGDGRWLVADAGGNELWRINPDDPGDTSGDFGLVGTFPSGLTRPRAFAYGDGRWLVADDNGNELWRINPDDPDDTSGDFGLVGTFPSGLGSLQGFAYGDGRWLIADDGGDELWRINPDDPGDTSGDFGLVGTFPSGLTSPLNLGYEPPPPPVVAQGRTANLTSTQSRARGRAVAPGAVEAQGRTGNLTSTQSRARGQAVAPGAVEVQGRTAHLTSTQGRARGRAVAPGAVEAQGRTANLTSTQSRARGRAVAPGAVEVQGRTAHLTSAQGRARGRAVAPPSTVVTRVSVDLPAPDQVTATQIVFGFFGDPITGAEIPVALMMGDAVGYLKVFRARTDTASTIQLADDDGQTEYGGSTGPRFSLALEEFEGAIELSAGSDSVVLSGPGLWVADPTVEPYFSQMPAADNTALAEWLVGRTLAENYTVAFADGAASAAVEAQGRTAHLTSTQGRARGRAVAGAPGALLTLADHDQTGHEYDFLALIEAGFPAGNTAVAYGTAPRPVAGGTLLDGNVDLGSDAGSPITWLRFRDADTGAYGSERVSFNVGNDGISSYLNLGNFYATGGDGADLSIVVQTDSGLSEFAVADTLGGSGALYQIFNVPVVDRSRIAGIAAGDRFIIGARRVAVGAVEAQGRTANLTSTQSRARGRAVAPGAVEAQGRTGNLTSTQGRARGQAVAPGAVEAQGRTANLTSTQSRARGQAVAPGAVEAQGRTANLTSAQSRARGQAVAPGAVEAQGRTANLTSAQSRARGQAVAPGAVEAQGRTANLTSAQSRARGQAVAPGAVEAQGRTANLTSAQSRARGRAVAPGAPLTLADHDQTGHEYDFLALIEAGFPAGNTAVAYGTAPRNPTGGMLLDGNVDLGPGAVSPITWLRFRDATTGAYGSERVSFNVGLDSGRARDSYEHLGNFYATGGAGADLSIVVQTDSGLSEFAVADTLGDSGDLYVIFNVPVADRSRIAGIAAGDRFIIGARRVAVGAVEAQGRTANLTSTQSRARGRAVVPEAVEAQGRTGNLTSTQGRARGQAVAPGAVEAQGRTAHLTSTQSRARGRAVAPGAVEAQGRTAHLTSAQGRARGRAVAAGAVEAQGRTGNLTSIQSRARGQSQQVAVSVDVPLRIVGFRADPGNDYVDLLFEEPEEAGVSYEYQVDEGAWIEFVPT